MQSKFQVRFTNGYWKVFNTEQYEDAAICSLRSEAEIVCAKMNAGNHRHQANKNS